MCLCVWGKKEEGLLPVFSAERKAEATHAERKKETLLHCGNYLVPSPTNARAPPPPLAPPAPRPRRTDPAPLHRIACVSPGFPAGGGFSDRRTSPAFPTRSRYGHFPFVVRRVVFCFASMEGAGPMWWWDCIALDETIDRVLLPPVVALRFRIATASSDRWAWNGIWVNCVGHMHDASYSCPLIS